METEKPFERKGKTFQKGKFSQCLESSCSPRALYLVDKIVTIHDRIPPILQLLFDLLEVYCFDFFTEVCSARALLRGARLHVFSAHCLGFCQPWLIQSRIFSIGCCHCFSFLHSMQVVDVSGKEVVL